MQNLEGSKAKLYLGPEDSCIGLHGTLHLAPNLSGGQGAGTVAQLVQTVQGVLGRVLRQWRLASPGLADLSCTLVKV